MSFLYISLFTGSLLVVLIVAFGAFDAAEQESRTVKTELAQAQQQSAALQEKVEVIRRWRHDANNLLQAMEYSLNESALLANRDISSAQDVLGMQDGLAVQDVSGAQSPSITQDVSGVQSPSAVQDVVVEPSSLAVDSLPDGIIAFKKHQCAQNSITFKASMCEGWMDVLRARGVEEADVAALLQNLLENAYEANLLLPDEASRSIVLLIDQSPEGALSIEVCNRIDPAQHTGFLSRKNPSGLHGVGLRIIDQIVEAHHGRKTVHIDQDARTLSTAILL